MQCKIICYHLNKDLEPDGIENSNCDLVPQPHQPRGLELFGVPFAVVEDGVINFLFFNPGGEKGDAE